MTLTDEELARLRAPRPKQTREEKLEAVLRNAAKHNPKALMAHAYRVTWQTPEDAPYVAAILHALFNH